MAVALEDGYQQEHTFLKKLDAVKKSFFAAFAHRYPRDNTRAIYDYKPRIKEGIEIDQDRLLDTIMQLHGSEVLPVSRKSKGYIMAMYLSFYNQHAVDVPSEYTLSSANTKEFIRLLFEKNRLSKDEDRRVSLAEQYAIAKSVLENSAKEKGTEAPDVLDVIHFLHLATRQMARGYDNRANPTAVATMRDAKKVLAPFGSHTLDVPGNTYHWWGAMEIGMAGSVAFGLKDHALNPVYRFIPRYTGFVSKHLMYRFGVNKGRAHTDIDNAGVAFGEKIAQRIVVQK